MDKFEDKMGEIAKEGLSEDKVNKRFLDDWGDDCICPDCPMYNQCAQEKYEGLYCLLGKSECNLEEDDCICPDCDVFGELDLKYDLYCIKGSEKELRGI
jgi:hypothetical protein